MSHDLIIQYLIALLLACIIPLLVILIYKISKKKSKAQKKTLSPIDSKSQKPNAPSTNENFVNPPLGVNPTVTSIANIDDYVNPKTSIGDCPGDTGRDLLNISGVISTFRQKGKETDKSKNGKKQHLGVPKLDMSKLAVQPRRKSDAKEGKSKLYTKGDSSGTLSNPFTQVGEKGDNFIMTLTHRGADEEDPSEIVAVPLSGRLKLTQLSIGQGSQEDLTTPENLQLAGGALPMKTTDQKTVKRAISNNRITEQSEENQFDTNMSSQFFDGEINAMKLEDDSLDITYNNITGVFGQDEVGGELDDVGDQAELQFGVDPNVLKGLDDEGTGDLSQRYNFQFTSRKDNNETNLEQEISQNFAVAKTPRQ